MSYVLRYEHRGQRPLTRVQFAQRMLRHGGVATILVAVSLAFGTLGYHALARESWIDALLNSAMLLGGMGPVGTIDNTGGKLFATFFALYAGLIFLVVAGLLLAPVFHRIIHRFHFDRDQSR